MVATSVRQIRHDASGGAVRPKLEVREGKYSIPKPNSLEREVQVYTTKLREGFTVQGGVRASEGKCGNPTKQDLVLRPGSHQPQSFLNLALHYVVYPKKAFLPKYQFLNTTGFLLVLQPRTESKEM